MGRKWDWGQIWRMYGEDGMAQADISAQLGIQQAEVSRILKRSPDYMTWKRTRQAYHRRATAMVRAAGELLGPEGPALMNSDGNDETNQDADGGWWVSVKGDYGRRDALGPFESEAEAKTIAGLLFAGTASPEPS